jgi:hypothetical protein
VRLRNWGRLLRKIKNSSAFFWAEGGSGDRGLGRKFPTNLSEDLPRQETGSKELWAFTSSRNQGYFLSSKHF